MKKILLLTTLLATFLVQAQQTNNETKRKVFNIAVRTGANLSKYTNVGADFQTAYYVGVSLPIEIAKVYTLNPEINFSAQGAKGIETNEYYFGSTNNTSKFDLKANYLSFNIVNRFYVNKLFFDFGPGLDFLLTKDTSIESDIDITFNVGLGYKLTDKILIQSRYKHGIVDAVTVTPVVDSKNQVISLGIQYKL